MKSPKPVKPRKRKPAKRVAAGGPVTLREVARAAGVSPMTVSNLINERAGTMRPETRRRI